jgi:hypothetical protein
MDNNILAHWELLLNQEADQSLFYQSPANCDHLSSFPSNGELYLATLEGVDGTLTGIVPFLRTTVSLSFQAKEKVYLYKHYIGIRILGIDLIASPSLNLLEELLQKINLSFEGCHAIEVKGLRSLSLLLDHLKKFPNPLFDFIVYTPEGVRTRHLRTLPGSYDEYLHQFSKKKRYNLIRQLRLMEDWSEGSLKLTRIQNPSQVQELLTAYEMLELISKLCLDSLNKEIISDLASRGLLLCYILSVKDRPCAVALGTHFMGTLLVHKIEMDKKLAKFSPGTVLNTLLIRDLIENKLAHKIDYGFGEPKYRMGNTIEQQVTLMLIRKSLSNHFIVGFHSLFVKLRNSMKALLSESRNQGKEI